jgi:division protein CdvB (Snf7/Vps24/ESCRT-III family)
VSFISKWTKPEKPGFAERIKNSIKPPPPLKPRIEQAQRKLQVQISRLDAVGTKLRERDQVLFRKIVAAVQQHEMQYSAILSNELAEIRKIGRMVNHAKLALEQIQIRMSTITELGDVVLALNPAMAVVKNVRTGLVGMMPEVDSEIEEVSHLLSGILVESAQVPNNTAPLTHTNDSEAQPILEEAAAVVEKSVKEKIPDLPTTIQEKVDREPELI